YPVQTESMTFQFSDITIEGCNLEFLWANTQVKLEIQTNVDEQVMKDIDVKMKGVSSATYYQAARYYYDNDKDLEQAYEWIKLSLVNNEKFWMVRQKALIEAKLGKYKDAIATATKSMELAKTAGNDNYVRLNEKSIAEWSKKKK
ncbi:MAG: tetratricopeptide (TPR) repeat protein, partial [Bacteroidia bacterium]